jgi:D-arabinose 5-phosphate isomerase GutQ
LSEDEFDLNQNVLLYLESGDLVGGSVSGKTKDVLKLSRASKVREDWVAGISELTLSRVGTAGDVDVPYTSIIRWRQLPSSLL